MSAAPGHRGGRLRHGSLAALAADARDGDREAAEALCLALKDPIFGFCLSRISVRADAEDVCQEVLMTVVARLDRLSDPDAVVGYALGIARNLVNRHHTRGPRRREVPFDAKAARRLQLTTEPAAAPGEPDPRDLLERRAAVLAGLVATEPQQVRALIDLHYRDGQTSVQIADRLGMRPSAVRMRLKRIRDRLLTRMLALSLEEAP